MLPLPTLPFHWPVDGLQRLARDILVYLRRLRFFPLSLLTFLAFAASAILLLASVSSELPDISDASVWQPPQSIVVTNSKGEQIYVAYENQDRIVLAHDQIPDRMRQAFVAIEDRRFYERPCIDLRAMARAVMANVSDFKSQGASTITQQLVRTALLDREKTFMRKAREILLACRLEGQMTKDEILDLYLNWAPFGQTLYGVEQASRHFFGVSAKNLTLAQTAILAALPQRPTYFSPYGKHRWTHISDTALKGLADGSIPTASAIPDAEVTIGLTSTGITIGNRTVVVGGRANGVLAAMQEQGLISEKEREQADRELLLMNFRGNVREMDAPHFVLNTLNEVEDLYADRADELWYSGLNVQTTIEPTLQAEAEKYVDEHVKTIAKYGASQMALLAVRRDTGEIVAYVGSSNYHGNGSGAKIDMVRAPRQPGSSFKPLVYAAAMQKVGWEATTIVPDTPLTINNYSPKNYDGKYIGRVQLITALNYSRNIPAIRAYQAIDDEDWLLDFIAKLGAPNARDTRQKSEENGMAFDYGWPMAIGTAETPLFEMVQAYSTLANSGTYLPLHGIASVQDRNGRTVYEPEQTTRQAVDPAIANMLTSILSESRSRPSGWWQTMTTIPGIDAAVKTGTSNVCLKRTKSGCTQMLPRDVWTIGFTPEFVVGVWVGNVDGKPLAAKADGLNVALPLWKKFLIGAHNEIDKPKSLFAGDQAPYYRRFPNLAQKTQSSSSSSRLNAPQGNTVSIDFDSIRQRLLQYRQQRP